MVYYTQYPSPVGLLLLTSDGENLTGLWMDKSPPLDSLDGGALPVFVQTAKWLNRYFQGERPVMDIPLSMTGTVFQQRVWNRLMEIPYGETCTYGKLAGEIARDTGKRMSAQAVGGAVGSNPVSILVPCHRVVGAGGKLTGYAGGLDRKQWLLSHEGWKG